MPFTVGTQGNSVHTFSPDSVVGLTSQFSYSRCNFSVSGFFQSIAFIVLSWITILNWFMLLHCISLEYISIKNVLVDWLIDWGYSASSSSLLLRDAPDTARILCRSFMLKHHRQLQVKDLPKVPTARAGFEPTTLRTKGDESTNEPPCPNNFSYITLVDSFRSLLFFCLWQEVIVRPTSMNVLLILVESLQARAV